MNNVDLRGLGPCSIEIHFMLFYVKQLTLKSCVILKFSQNTMLIVD